MAHLRAYAVSAGAALLGLSLMAEPVAAASAEPDISGIYWAEEYSAKIRPLEGGELPFTAAGKAAYARNVAGLKDGSVTDRARRYCTPDGIPRALATPYPFEIVQAPPGQVLIVYEMNHMVRRVPIGGKFPPDAELIADPYSNGHSIGHFEGDTLVVQTKGFKDETFLDATGAPHTDMLETTERIRKVSPTQLEDVVTVHDPEYYSKDWQARFVYALRNDLKIEDYICGLEHRDISSVKGVRRR